ncbi:hypothetical protein NP233_g9718 [Leucocoprinus birnbaumii]|uniref:Uncharacterized protein n=1 Tax=Leucocoprinus birnbaumii TaxID=56174 RepID=A0AAD5YLZ2_9AGAR|nr:hypothetical protein NP233_g9718 [Leucocoprinus birnbaumii]
MLSDPFRRVGISEVDDDGTLAPTPRRDSSRFSLFFLCALWHWTSEAETYHIQHVALTADAHVHEAQAVDGISATCETPVPSKATAALDARYGGNYLWQRYSSGLSTTWPPFVLSDGTHNLSLVRVLSQLSPPFNVPSMRPTSEPLYPLPSSSLPMRDLRAFPSSTGAWSSIAHRWEAKPTICLVYKDYRYESKMGHYFNSFSAVLPTAAASYGSRDALALVRIGSREVLEEHVERDRVYELTKLHPRIFFTACIVSRWDASMQRIGRSWHWTCMEVIDGFTERTRTRAEMMYIVRKWENCGWDDPLRWTTHLIHTRKTLVIEFANAASQWQSVNLLRATTHREYRGNALLLDMDALSIR